MIVGFIIWSMVCLALFSVGVYAWNSKEAVGFFTGIKPPEVKDIQGYNRSVAILWSVYAALLEALGVPFIFLEQNSAGFVPVILGVVAITIALFVIQTRIENKCRLSAKKTF